MATKTDPRDLPISKRIRWARKRVGLSQEKLALVARTTRRHVIRLENGENMPGPELRQRLGEATGQAADLFKNGDEDGEEAA